MYCLLCKCMKIERMEIVGFGRYLWKYRSCFYRIFLLLLLTSGKKNKKKLSITCPSWLLCRKESLVHFGRYPLKYWICLYCLFLHLCDVIMRCSTPNVFWFPGVVCTLWRWKENLIQMCFCFRISVGQFATLLGSWKSRCLRHSWSSWSSTVASATCRTMTASTILGSVAFGVMDSLCVKVTALCIRVCVVGCETVQW